MHHFNNALALDAEYLAMARRDPAALRRDFDAIVEYMKHSTAIHHGEYVRTCFKPKLLTESQFAAIKADMKILYAIFARVMDEYEQDASYRALFGFDPRVEELILRANRQPSLLPMARIDFFYNEETGDYIFCEFNTDGASAMNEDRELHNAQQLSAVYREFTAAHKTRRCELFDSWVETMKRIWQRAGGHGVPRVAIVDYMECGTVNEFEIFRQHFEQAGVPAEVCDVRALRYDGHTLIGDSGEKIDMIYRRAVTSDVLAHYEESTALLQAARDGAVLLVGDFHTQIVHNKELFRVLHLPRTLQMLDETQCAYIKAHVPYTAEFGAEHMEQVLQDKDRWILKPTDSYGSRGVYAGVEYDNDRWAEIVRSVPHTGYLLQAFHTPYVTENYGLNGDVFGLNRYYNLTGIYTYDGVAQGVYSRVSLTPIISSQYSEKTLPTLLVED